MTARGTGRRLARQGKGRSVSRSRSTAGLFSRYWVVQVSGRKVGCLPIRAKVLRKLGHLLPYRHEFRDTSASRRAAAPSPTPRPSAAPSQCYASESGLISPHPPGCTLLPGLLRPATRCFNSRIALALLPRASRILPPPPVFLYLILPSLPQGILLNFILFSPGISFAPTAFASSSFETISAAMLDHIVYGTSSLLKRSLEGRDEVTQPRGQWIWGVIALEALLFLPVLLFVRHRSPSVLEREPPHPAARANFCPPRSLTPSARSTPRSPS